MRVDTYRTASPVAWVVVPAYAWAAAFPVQGAAFALPEVAALQKASRVALREHWVGYAAYPVPSAAVYRMTCRA